MWAWPHGHPIDPGRSLQESGKCLEPHLSRDGSGCVRNAKGWDAELGDRAGLRQNLEGKLPVVLQGEIRTLGTTRNCPRFH